MLFTVDNSTPRRADQFITQVELHDAHDHGAAWQTWILKPEKAAGTFIPSHFSLGTPGVGTPPPNDGDAARFPTQTQHSEYERDYFGTIVTEVNTVINTNTVTTRKRYRVEDASSDISLVSIRV